MNWSNNTQTRPEYLKQQYIESAGYLTSYYMLTFLLFLIIWYVSFCSLNMNFASTLAIIYFGNMLIASITQLMHYKRLEQTGESLDRDFLHNSIYDCIIRCSAGILEVVVYAILFAFSQPTVIAGYLIMKGVRAWKSNTNENNEKMSPQRKEGLSTAVLRIAVVLSLLIAFVASYYLKISLGMDSN